MVYIINGFADYVAIKAHIFTIHNALGFHSSDNCPFLGKKLTASSQTCTQCKLMEMFNHLCVTNDRDPEHNTLLNTLPP